MTLLDEYYQALAEWQEATAAFNAAADDAYVDYYTLRLTAAEHKLDMVLRLLKAEHTDGTALTR